MPQDLATNGTLITGAFVQEFHTGYELACQRKLSVLESLVTPRGSITGSSFTINDMGLVEMVDRKVNPATGVQYPDVSGANANRFQDTVWSVPDAGTRVAMMGDSELFVPVEKMDLPKLLANPQGPYQQLCVAAANRKKDRVIYGALLNSIGRRTADLAGNAALTATALPASQKLTGSGSGGVMTKLDLIRVRALFRKNEADDEQINILFSSDMLTAILNDTTLTSADFMAVKMLQEGDISGKWLGMNWTPYESLNYDNTSKKFSTVAFTKSSTHFGSGMDLSIDIGPRRDKRNVIQIGVQTSYGAGRANEQKVVQLDFVAG